MENTYNGWTNRNTWLLNLNLTNDYGISKFLESEINNMSLSDFIIYCNCVKNSLVDSINYSQVNFKEVFEALGGASNEY